ncbi:hypothetical protein LUZ60_002923 [Juncus effusus]|nr:hypothetical protein LUZ60_002923 [Juncus effusus]
MEETQNRDEFVVIRDGEELVGDLLAMEETQNRDEFVVIRDGEEVVEENPDDSTLAEELQIQEVIIFFIESQKLPEESAQGAIDLIKDPIDPKGKKAETSFSITERGESSKITPESFYCVICMEPNPTLESFIINPCDHMFCNTCMSHYVTSKVGENTTKIRCPNVSCESEILDPLACQQIVSSDVFERWNISLCESLLGLKKIYCPFNDCSALLLDERDEGDSVTNSECPHCHRMFCVRCKVPWHGDMTCEEFEKLGEDEREKEGLMLRDLAKNSKWQRCPHCRMYVERIDGCKFMKCRCGYGFCYGCGTPMSSENHYCNECKR